MSTYMKIVTSALVILFSSNAYAQPASSCSSQQKYVDSVERCVDTSSEDVIALGTLRVEATRDGTQKIVLHDETRGNIDLLLTPTLVEAVESSPAESFEVEGYLTNGELTVKNLRPIE